MIFNFYYALLSHATDVYMLPLHLQFIFLYFEIRGKHCGYSNWTVNWLHRQLIYACYIDIESVGRCRISKNSFWTCVLHNHTQEGCI